MFRRLPQVPVILQMEQLECGAACLTMVLAYYGSWVPLEEVRVACGVSRDGSNARDIVLAAQGYGLRWRAKRYSVARLQEAGTFPAIIHWNLDHFVVLRGFRGRYAYLVDPAIGRVRVEMDDFLRSYAGVCIELEPGTSFRRGGRRVGIAEFVATGTKGRRAIVALVMVSGLFAGLAGVLIPVLVRVFTDEVLGNGRTAWARGIFALFGATIAFSLVASLVSRVLIRRATGKVAVTASARFMRHVLRMPMGFFAQRSSADLASRQGANDAVAQTLIGRLAPSLLNLLLIAFYLLVMIRYNVTLAILCLLTALANLLVAYVISARRNEVGAAQARDRARLDSATVSGIDMIETIKASGAEDGYFERWSGLQALVVKSQVRFARLNKFIGTLPSLLQEVSNVTVLLAGLWLIMEGEFSAGLLVSFQLFMGAFLDPVNQLIEAGQSLQEMRVSMERIEDVTRYPEDPALMGESVPLDYEDAAKLAGRIELRGVTFGYSALSEPTVRDVSFVVEPGKSVALVGGSGSGKSTIAKLVCGLYQPWEGEVLFDGRRMEEIPTEVLRSSLALVDQHMALFNDTIENNIKMWDTTLEDYEMIVAAHDAGVHTDIVSRAGGYQRVLREGGRDLSGGQRQRIELARALVGAPTALVLDEATSALDAVTEHEVLEYIRRRGNSCVVVAHRLSAVRDCDEILVVDDGRIVERGTHEELYGRDGLYKALVMME